MRACGRYPDVEIGRRKTEQRQRLGKHEVDYRTAAGLRRDECRARIRLRESALAAIPV
jgi:hypothetical protein